MPGRFVPTGPTPMEAISQITLLIGSGIAAQWLAWRVKLPSILLLLVFGFAAGPGLGWLDPDATFGDALFPLVSLAVGLILFEGGMSLELRELRETGKVILLLVGLGGLVTWVASAAAAYYLLGFGVSISVLTGAVLVVTGPTVILPLLRQVRPSRRLRTILKWEGITIDPVGATLALLVFESILVGQGESRALLALQGVAMTLGAGIVIGVISSAILILMFRRYWVPDYLQEVVTLAVVLSAFTVSNHVQHESGLLTVTLMGVIMANQKWVPVHHILHFKENLRVLLIAGLFTLLSSRVPAESLLGLGWREAAFVAALILVVRPLSVMVATVGGAYNWRERLFLGFLAPRGIVAAAVASLFSLKLVQVGIGEAAALVPVVFATIVGTVFVYGLGARPLAQALGLTERDPQGILIVGAHPWARAIANALREEHVRCVLIDTNFSNVSAARQEGLDAHFGSVLSEDVRDELDLDGIGKLLALTQNDEANSLATLHFARVFGREQVFQLTPSGKAGHVPGTFSPRHLRGRYAFGPDHTFAEMEERFNAGAVVKMTTLTAAFDFDAFEEMHGDTAIPLLSLETTLGVRVLTDEPEPDPGPGSKLVYVGA